MMALMALALGLKKSNLQSQFPLPLLRENGKKPIKVGNGVDKVQKGLIQEPENPSSNHLLSI
jgi:hypothetical protein